MCVAVFAQGEAALQAKEAGADIVGDSDLADEDGKETSILILP